MMHGLVVGIELSSKLLRVARMAKISSPGQQREFNILNMMTRTRTSISDRVQEHWRGHAVNDIIAVVECDNVVRVVWNVE